MSLESPFEHFPELETERLILRTIRISDADSMFEIKSDREVTSRYGAEAHESIERTRKWIELVLKDYMEHTVLYWCITMKGDDTPIGSFTLWNLDLKSSCGELGYEMNRAYWGRGIMHEALARVVDWAFAEMGLNRIEACPLSINTPSRNILEKLGFRLEGNLRERIYFNGNYEDQVYYSLLKREWEESVRGRNKVP